jgi:hypothetical protein
VTKTITLTDSEAKIMKEFCDAALLNGRKEMALYGSGLPAAMKEKIDSGLATLESISNKLGDVN